MSTFAWGVALVIAGGLAAIVLRDAFREFADAGFGELELGPDPDFEQWARQMNLYDWAAE